MPSAAQIAAKVAYGLGKVGSVLGDTYQWYRPQGTGPVIAEANLQGSTLAYVVTKQTLTPSPSDWGKADRYADFDPTNFLAGDYLVADQTMFVAEIVSMASSVRLVLCNETFSWTKMQDPPPGPAFRPGARVEVQAASGWPGWLQSTDRRSQAELHLPGAVDMPAAQILLPASFPGQLVRGDRLTTSETLAIAYTVQSAVLSPNGWMITAVRAGA